MLIILRDAEESREIVDLFGMLDWMIQTYSQVATVVGLDLGPDDVKGIDIFTRSAERGKLLKKAWKAEAEQRALQQHAPLTPGASGSAAPGDAVLNGLSMEFGDLQDFDWDALNNFTESLFVT
jgi:hypothetical protein